MSAWVESPGRRDARSIRQKFDQYGALGCKVHVLRQVAGGLRHLDGVKFLSDNADNHSTWADERAPRVSLLDLGTELKRVRVVAHAAPAVDDPTGNLDCDPQNVDLGVAHCDDIHARWDCVRVREVEKRCNCLHL